MRTPRSLALLGLCFYCLTIEFIGAHKLGGVCSGDEGFLPDPSSNIRYLFCDNRKGIFVWYLCPKVADGEIKVQKVFDPTFQECRWPNSFLLNAAGSAKVGDQCSYNTDCLEGMYCNTGTCTCLSTYVEVDKFCYQKIDPSRRGCQYNEQCESVWPGATCTITGAQGQCNCPQSANGIAYIPVQTKDGFLCLSQDPAPAAATGRCPLPDLTGVAGVTDPWQTYLQYSSATNKAIATCQVGSTSTTDRATSCSSENTAAGVYVGDLYDCIPLIFTAPLTATTQGLCCPNRANTCIQPQASNPPDNTNTAETRWWYNSVTRTCEQFYWTPPTANSNNFITRTQCQTYCQDTCTRGYPEYDASNQVAVTGTPRTCQSSGSGSSQSSCADSDHTCTSIGSQQFCCSTTDFLCSAQGGRPMALTPPANQLFDAGFTPKAASNAALVVQRFFFNEDTNQCEPFQYLGAGGNFNNFLTRDDCQTFCQKLLCEHGTPILDASGQQYQQCSSGSNCPSTHTCSNSVCCPTVQTVCAEPKQLGTCSQFTTRYWYNARTQECEPFDFTGCQGNDNNFQTMYDCQIYCRNASPEPQCIQGEAYKDANGNYYKCSNTNVGGNACPLNYECFFDGYVYGCCPTQAYTCSLSSSMGATCGSQSSRWYYDTQTQTCQTFTYQGCNGNSNNFPTRQLCESYCGVGGCPYGGEPYRASDNALRLCSAGVSCPSQYECLAVSVGTSSLNYCCPTRTFLCSTPPNQSATCGSGQAITRYYYNRAVGSCLTFQYYGCGTPSNNFATLSQCDNFCNSAGCAVGETAYIDPNNQRALTCNIALKGTCPNGYACTFDSLNNKNICCGASNMGVCPSTEKAYIDPFTQQAKECLPNVAGTCSNDYLCRFLTSANKYYCCKADNYCPIGHTIFEDPNTKRGQVCLTNNVINTCPNGFSCQSNVAQSFQGFCCSINPVCPNGGKFYPDRNDKNKAMTCILSSFGTNPCPTNYQCIPSGANTTTGYCCAGGTANVCPNNVQVYKLNNNPVTCQQNSQAVSCPVGYSCQQFGTTSIFYCCQNSALPTPVDGCGPGQVAFRNVNNQISQCSTSPPTNCPIGFSCQYSFSTARFQCCGFQGGCPANSAVYQDSTGQTQYCQIGSTTCPFGFQCTTNSQNSAQGICCSVGGSQAPIPTTVGRAGFPCGTNGQCSGGSRCTGNVCTCPSGQAPAGGNCVQGLSACLSGAEFLYPATQTPIDCSPLRGNCPQPYRCALSTAYGGYFVCCSGNRKLRGEALLKAHELLKKQEQEKASRRSKQAKDMGQNEEWKPLAGIISKAVDPYGNYTDQLGVITPWSRQGAKKTVTPASQIGLSPNVSRVNLPVKLVVPQTKMNATRPTICNPAQRVFLGGECCADAQCQYNCGNFRGKAICACSRNMMLDLTMKPPRCVSGCSKWREGAFCVSSNRYSDSFTSQYAPIQAMP